MGFPIHNNVECRFCRWGNSLGQPSIAEPGKPPVPKLDAPPVIQCRRYPPTFPGILPAGAKQPMALWPTLGGDCYCGEFAPKVSDS